MAIFNIFNFCTGDTQQAQASAGTVSVSSYESGKFAARFNPTAGTGELTFGLWQANGGASNFNNAAGACRVRFKVNTLPASTITILKFLVTGTVDWFEVRVTSAGRLQLYNDTAQIGSNSVQCVLNVEYTLDLRLVVSATVGELAAKLNGVEFAAGSSLNTGTANVIQMKIGAMDVNSSADISFFDGVIGDANSYLPAGEFCDMIPNAAGTYAEEASGTYAGLDERPVSTSDWVARSGAPGSTLRWSYNMTDPVIAPNTIHAVMTWIYYDKAAAATSTELLTRSGSTDNYTTARTASGTKISQKVHTVDPADSSAWTEADLDGLEVGMRTVVVEASKLWACGAVVYYTRSANVVGKGYHANALGESPQVKVITDGYHSTAIYYPGDGSAVQAKASISTSDDDIWRESQVPTMDTCDRGHRFTMFYEYETTYSKYGTFNVGTTPKACSFVKGNRNLIAEIFSAGTAITDITDYPSISWVFNADASSTVFLAGIGAGKVRVKTSADLASYTNQSAATDIHTVVGTNSCPQIVRYSNGEVGILYSDDTTLYYKHYNGSWGSAETVTTNLNYATQYRGTVTQNDKLMVVWVGPSSTPYYLLQEDGFRIFQEIGDDIIWEQNKVVGYRIRPQAGAFGTELDVSTDRATAYITATANMAKAEEVVIFYQEDGANDIVYRIWNGTSWSTKTIFVSAPTLQGSINAPPQSVGQTTLLYYTTDGYIRAKRLALTATEWGVDGILVDSNSHFGATPSISTVTFSYGGKTMMLWHGIDHRAYARVMTDSTETWDSAAVNISPDAFWDLHNHFTLFGDDSGYVYLAAGNRASSSSLTKWLENSIILKSTYPLNHASFSLGSWTDISPDSVTGRGYKFILVDQAGVIYLIDTERKQPPDHSQGPIRIREYRSGSWSAPTSLVYGENTDIFVYVTGIQLGNEASGQKSIHLFWNWHDVTDQPGWYNSDALRMSTFYQKIVPQGDGTFKVYKADGTDQTASLPLDTTNSDTVYNGATGAYWSLSFCGAEVLTGNVPFIAITLVSKTSPYAVQAVRGFYWSGTAWVGVDIRNSDFDISADPKAVKGTYLFVIMTVSVAGVRQLVYYQSANDGVTWTGPVQLTNSTVGTTLGLVSKRTDTLLNLTWLENVSDIHKETRIDTFQYVILPPTMQGVGSIQGIGTLSF